MYYPCKVITVSAQNIPKQDMVIGRPLPGYVEVTVEYQPKDSIFPQTYTRTLKWYPEEKELRDTIQLPTRVGSYKFKSVFFSLWEMVEIWDFVVVMHDKGIIPDDYFQWFKEIVEKEVK